MCMLYSFKCNPGELKTTLPLCIHNIPLCVSPSCRSRFMGSKSSGKITLLVWSGSVAVTLIFKFVWYLSVCLIGATVTVTIIQATNPWSNFWSNLLSICASSQGSDHSRLSKPSGTASPIAMSTHHGVVSTAPLVTATAQSTGESELQRT